MFKSEEWLPAIRATLFFLLSAQMKTGFIAEKIRHNLQPQVAWGDNLDSDRHGQKRRNETREDKSNSQTVNFPTVFNAQQTKQELSLAQVYSKL
jgi:hypothetical protein